MGGALGVDSIMKVASKQPVTLRAPDPTEEFKISKDVHSVILETRLKKKLSDVGWRSAREVMCRRTIAWCFSAFVVLISCFVSVIYGLKFGDTQIRKAAIAWLVAYGWTFALVEPVQV